MKSSSSSKSTNSVEEDENEFEEVLRVDGEAERGSDSGETREGRLYSQGVRENKEVSTIERSK